MLHPALSQSIEQDHLTVLYSFEPRAIVAAQARLAAAVRPFGSTAPDFETLSVLATHNVTSQSVSTLNSILAQVGTQGGDYATRMTGLSNDATYNAFFRLANWVALGAQTTPSKAYLFEEPAVKSALDRLTKLDSEGGNKDDGGWLSPSDVNDLAIVTLWASFSRLTSSFLVTEEETPQGSPKDIFPVVKRIQKAVCIVAALRHAIALCGLRERAAFLMSEVIKPWHPWISALVREEVTSLATKVLALKVHPWLAQAERMRLPARRPTLWGRANNTMGVSSSISGNGLWHRIAAFNSRNPDSAGGGGADMRDMVLDETDDSLVMGFYREARELFLLRETLPTAYLTLAEGVFELSHPSTPPYVHLYGQTWTPLIMTGDRATESVTDLLTIINRPRFPLRTASGDAAMIAGNAFAYDYNAESWRDGGEGQDEYSLATMRRPTHVPPLYDQPQRPEITKGYGLGLLVPEMIQPVIDTEYFGDEDALFFPYEPEELARALSFTSIDAMRQMPRFADRMAHLFTFDASTKKFTRTYPKATRLFTSSRTSQPWRRPVHIPVAMPTKVVALDFRTSPLSGAIQAVVTRDPSMPVMVQGTLATADSMAVEAVRALGFSKGQG